MIPRGLTKQAEAERRRFERAYKANLKAASKVPLSILVWGQNPKAKTAVAQKRKDIRRQLLRLGHNAMFSEDISANAGAGLSEKSKEFAQAQAVDLIIILVEDAPGASAEAHDFANHPDLASKVYVMIPERYRSGYSAQGAIKDLDDGYGGVYWYADGEIESCKVLGQAVKRAEARRQIRFRAKNIW